MTGVTGPPLVTGASGFAGSHLVERLLESHPTVLAWSHTAPVTPELQRPGVEWRQVDLLDRVSVADAIRATRPSVVYHCAGLPHVAESWSRAALALEVNAMGTHHLLRAIEAEAPTCKTLVVGSALVYRPSPTALTEDSPLGPSDPYGVSKLAQEMIGLRAPTAVVVARPFNHAGPRQSASFVTSSFAKQVAEIEAGRSEPTLRVGNLDARRDLTDVRDTARAYEALAEKAPAGGTYNVCSGVAHRIGDLLEILLAASRVPITVVQDPARLRPSDNPVVVGDPARVLRDTGWRARIPIEDTLRDLLDWWRARVNRPVS